MSLIIRRLMSTSMNMATETAKRVPIPCNGVDYRGKLVLAPMVRSGELPSRLMALKYGADLVWGPETVDRAMIGTTRRVNEKLSTIDFTRLPSNQLQKKKSEGSESHTSESLIYRLHPEREGKRLVFQLGTSDPERAVAAARLVAADVAGIDVNAGCPKPFSVSGGMGAALLRTPDKLCAILRALVATIVPEFNIGISVKIRLLETPEETAELVRSLVATGITGLTIHCRTTPMRPRERAIREQLRMIADICHDAGVACLMNGDVTDRAQALGLISEFGVDGAMIATAAETNPSCFSSEGLRPWREVVTEYIRTAMEVENRFGNTKYLLGQMVPGKAPEYRGFTSSKSYVQICNILGLEGDDLEKARITDAALNIKEPSQKPAEKAKKNNQSARAAGGQSTRVPSQKNKNRNVNGQNKNTLDASTFSPPAQAQAVPQQQAV